MQLSPSNVSSRQYPLTVSQDSETASSVVGVLVGGSGEGVLVGGAGVNVGSEKGVFVGDIDVVTGSGMDVFVGGIDVFVGSGVAELQAARTSKAEENKDTISTFILESLCKW
jgi:Ca2+-binding RTX toxin-like protein